ITLHDLDINCTRLYPYTTLFRSVDGFLAGLNQGFIRARKWLRSEKAPARRQRRGMRGSDNGGIRKKARGGLGIFAPQDRDELGAIQGADSGFGDFFPAHFAMRAGISGLDRKSTRLN